LIAMRKAQKCLFDLAASDLDEIVRGAKADLGELRGQRIFLTGGTGFFGKWLLAALAWADAKLELKLKVTVLSRDPARFLEQYPAVANHAAIRFQAGDVAELSPGEERYEYVLHAATDTLGIATPEAEKKRARAIVEGTRRVLAFAQQGGARRFLYVSSGAVYGAAASQLSGASEEDFDSAVAATPYGRAKREAEQLCHESQLDFVTARAFAFLGPHLPLDAHYAAGNFLRDARRGGPIVVQGDGSALRSYLYPSDLVVALLRLLVRGQAGRAYNIGSDEATNTGDLARRIAAACAPPPEVTVQSTAPPGPQNIYLPDIGRARAELSLEVTVPLSEAIRRTLLFLGN
jgi:nucleoside-diphosphate-sugar epimerase